jgi:O-methyltransferase involved in polyketide biosynthesis
VLTTKNPVDRPIHSINTLNEVSQTPLIPLYFRALESQRLDALIRDPKAVELVGQLAQAFLAEHPFGVIVDLGCGLDTRSEQFENVTACLRSLSHF